ncbi:hypothetical protein HBM95_17735 [Enterobacter asburiae]|nr:hypothetical protein [Enterobacter asburiae]
MSYSIVMRLTSFPAADTLLASEAWSSDGQLSRIIIARRSSAISLSSIAVADGISLCDAVNFIVERYELVRTDHSCFSLTERSSLIGAIDILRARRATGLIVSSGYSTITRITTGRYQGGEAQ